MDSTPLLAAAAPPMDGVVDYRGRPIFRSTSGGWSSALFIMAVEIAERCAFAGISSNLITYLTGPLRLPTGSAALAVNAWGGACAMLPLLGGFLADSYLGRYRTIVLASLLYLLGLGLLTVSSMLPSVYPLQCNGPANSTACGPTQFQIALVFFSLYLVALAEGGHKPCVMAFGADQFDANDPEECKSKGSFFSWWYFGICVGATSTSLALNYVQDNVSWVLGFGIPFIFMALSFSIFVLGTRTYRCYLLEGKHTFVEISRAFIALVKGEAGEPLLPFASDQYRISNGSQVDNVGQVEAARGLLRLFPIWATGLIFAVVLAQTGTFFTKQGRTLDRRIGKSFEVPPAAMQSIIGFTVIAFIPIYDHVVVAIARRFTRIPSGITMLQRIGTGMILSVTPVVCAALVEMKRLKTAREFGLVDMPDATVPMSVCWLLPQYILNGIADVFLIIGSQHFFYDQVPDALRSLGIALYLSVLGIGCFVSGFLVSMIDKVTGRMGESWFSDNLNRAHLDYFYWLLAGLSAINVVIFLYFARSYVYRKKALITEQN